MYFAPRTHMADCDVHSSACTFMHACAYHMNTHTQTRMHPVVKLKKKDVGLPHVSKATELQKRDGMCWEKEDELYNNGGAFKICARDARGVMVTIIADNVSRFVSSVPASAGVCVL
jgi:hypothetical protein